MRLITVSKEKFNDSRFEKIFVIKRTRSLSSMISRGEENTAFYLFSHERALPSFLPFFSAKETN